MYFEKKEIVGDSDSKTIHLPVLFEKKTQCSSQTQRSKVTIQRTKPMLLPKKTD